MAAAPLAAAAPATPLDAAAYTDVDDLNWVAFEYGTGIACVLLALPRVMTRKESVGASQAQNTASAMAPNCMGSGGGGAADAFRDHGHAATAPTSHAETPRPTRWRVLGAMEAVRRRCEEASERCLSQSPT